jgi:peptidase inhibitor I9
MNKISGTLITIILSTIAISANITFLSPLMSVHAENTTPLGGNSTNETKVNGGAKVDQLANQYIITIKNSSNANGDLQSIVDDVKKRGAEVIQIYQYSIKGFSIKIPQQLTNSIVNHLKADPRVSNVEQDQKMTIAPLK